MAQNASVDILINAKDNASKEISKVQGSLGGLSNSFASVVKAGAVAAAGLGVAAGAMGAKLAMSAVQGASSVEQQTVAFTTLLGSADKAKEAIANISEDAKSTPFELPGLIKGNQLLIAAGVSAGDARKDFLSLGNAVSAVGGGQAELDRLALNLQQIKATGKAAAIDIKQFAFSGIPIYGLLADSMGTTEAKIQDMVSEGKVGYDQVTEALEKAAGAGGRFEGALKNQSQTFAGVVSNIKDSFNITMSQIAKDSGLFDAVKNAANGLLTAMDSNKDKIKEFATAFTQGAIPVLMNAGKWIFETGKKAYEMGQSFVNGLKLLESKTGVFTMLQTSVMYVVDAVMNNLLPALINNKDLFAAIGATILTVAGYLGSFLITAIAVAVNVISGLLNVVASATEFFVKHKDAIKDLAIALAITLSPAIVLVGVVLGAMAISAVAAFGAWAIAALSAVASTLLLFAPIILIGAAVALTAFAIIHWWDKIKLAATLMGKAMVESFNWIGSKLQWLVGAFVSTLTAFGGLFVKASNVVGNALQGLVGFIAGSFGRMKDIVVAIGGFMVNTISTGFGKIVNIVSNVFNTVVDTVRGFIGRFMEVGSNIVQGLIDGIRNGKDAVINVMKDIAGGAIDTVKNFLGIHSPSRVFKQIGEHTIQGLVDGMNAKKGGVTDASVTIVNSIVDAHDKIKDLNKQIAEESRKSAKDMDKDRLAALQTERSEQQSFLDAHKNDQKQLSKFISAEMAYRAMDSVQKAKDGGKNTIQAYMDGVNEKKSALSTLAQSINTAFTSALSIRNDAQGSIVKDIVDAKENLAKTTSDLNAQRALPADDQDKAKITELENTQRTLSQFLERHKKDQLDLSAFIKKEEQFRSMDSIQQTKFRMNEQLKEVQDGLKAQINAFKKAFKDLSKDKDIKKLFGGVDNFAKIFGNFGSAVSVQSIPGFAGGVENFSGGLAMVGENGPEMVRLPKGADVIPNHQLSGQSGVHVENHFYNPVLSHETDMQKLAAMVEQSLTRKAQLANKGI